MVPGSCLHMVSGICIGVYVFGSGAGGGTGPYDVSQRSTPSYILSASKSRVQAPVVLLLF